MVKPSYLTILKLADNKSFITVEWYRMLTHIQALAIEIDSALQTKAGKWGTKINRPEMLADISRGVRYIANRAGSQIQRFLAQNSPLRHDTLAEIFRTIMQISSPYSLHQLIAQLHSALVSGYKANVNGSIELPTLTGSIHGTVSAELLAITNADQITSSAAKYISGLVTMWDEFSILYSLSPLLIGPDGLMILKTPFIHEFYFTESMSTDPPFLPALLAADTKCLLHRDSLGRSPLHFATEN
jgi:hypothetical protein